MISIEVLGNIIEFFQKYSLLDFLHDFSCQKKRNCYYTSNTGLVSPCFPRDLAKKETCGSPGSPLGGEKPLQVPRANMYMGSVELINRKIASIEGHFGPSTVTSQATDRLVVSC